MNFGIASRHPCLNARATIEPLHRGFAAYSLEASWNYSSASADLLGDSAVHRVVPVYFSPPYSGELKYTDVIDVRFKPDLTVDSMMTLLKTVALHVVDSNTIVHGLWRCALDDTVRGSPLEYVNRLHSLDETIWASATFSAVATPQSDGHDPLFGYQYYLENTGDPYGALDVDIDADSAWMIPLLDSSLIVAVIDVGMETHPEFPGARVMQGYDFVGENWYPPYGLRPDYDPSAGRQQGHGMACAGIIGAGHDLQGIMGIMGSCRFLPIKVSDDSILHIWPDVQEHPWVYSDAIRWAATHGARVISCSWGVVGIPWVATIADAIEEVVDSCHSGTTKDAPACRGCVMVFAAGNDGETQLPLVQFPAIMQQVIAVGAIDRYGLHWDYSNQGPTLDVVAPSGYKGLQGDQWTTDRVGILGWNPQVAWGPGNSDYTNVMSGTSGATPQVAGIAALVLARRTDFDTLYHDLLGNDTLPRVIRRIVEGSAVDWGADTLPGFDTVFGYGLANAYRALLSVIRGDVDNNARIDTVDVRKMEEYCFRHGPAPVLDRRVADTDGDKDADIIDYLRTLGAASYGRVIPPCYSY